MTKSEAQPAHRPRQQQSSEAPNRRRLVYSSSARSLRDARKGRGRGGPNLERGRKLRPVHNAQIPAGLIHARRRPPEDLLPPVAQPRAHRYSSRTITRTGRKERAPRGSPRRPHSCGDASRAAHGNGEAILFDFVLSRSSLSVGNGGVGGRARQRSAKRSRCVTLYDRQEAALGRKMLPAPKTARANCVSPEPA